MTNNQNNCQNCEKSYDEGFQFCPHCGQKTNDELTIGVLFYNTISNYFSFDARFFKSFIPLMFKPGYLAKEFIKGKRLLFLHPAQMYLFVAVIFFFIFNFYVRESREVLDKNMQDVLASRTEKIKETDTISSKDSLNVEALLKPLKENSKILGLDEDAINAIDSLSAIKVPKTMGLGQIYQTFIDSIPLAMFFLLPIFAFLLKLFFYRKGRYSHHLVFSFYYFSFLFTVFSIVFAVNRWIIDIPDWIDVIIALSTFFYLLFAIIKFYGQNWFLSILKSGLVSFSFIMIVLPFAFVILGFIAFLFY